MTRQNATNAPIYPPMKRPYYVEMFVDTPLELEEREALEAKFFDSLLERFGSFEELVRLEGDQMALDWNKLIHAIADDDEEPPSDYELARSAHHAQFVKDIGYPAAHFKLYTPPTVIGLEYPRSRFSELRGKNWPTPQKLAPF